MPLTHHNDDIGPATVTITAEDEQRFGPPPVPFTPNGVDTDVILVAIAAVNDPPLFRFTDQILGTPGKIDASVTVIEDDLTFGLGAHTFLNFVTAIQAGPVGATDETLIGQSPVFQVVSVNASPILTFSAGPAISQNGTLTFTTAPDAHGTATVVVVLIDQDILAHGGPQTSLEQTFTITVTPVNDAPTLTSPPNPRVTPVNEDDIASNGMLLSDFLSNQPGSLNPALYGDVDGLSTVPGESRGIAVINANQTNGVWQFRLTNALPWTNFPASASLSVTSALVLGADAETRIRFVPNTNGPSFSPPTHFNSTTGITFRFHAWDQFNVSTIPSGSVGVNLTGQFGGANSFSTASAVATIVVNPVNDPPIITQPANDLFVQTVDEDSNNTGTPRLFSFVNFAAASPGPAGVADEQAQTIVSFSATTLTGANLFAVQPAIDPSGRLSFVLNPDANGTATFSFTAMDSGDTLNGGRNVSDPRTVTITVQRVNDTPIVNQAPTTVTLLEGVLTNTTFAFTGPNTITVDDDDRPWNGDNNSYSATLSIPSGTGTLAVPGGILLDTNPLAEVIQIAGTRAQINSTIALLTYTTPNPNFNELNNGSPLPLPAPAPVPLSVTVDDGGFAGTVGSANEPTTSPVRNVNIRISPTNDQPGIVLPTLAAMPDEGSVGFAILDAVSSGIRITDVDSGEVAGAEWTVVLSIPLGTGTLTVSTTAAGGVPAAQIFTNGTRSVTLRGSLPQLQTTLETLTYSVPNDNFNSVIYAQTVGCGGPGTCSIPLVVSVNDNGNVGTGTFPNPTATLNITVNPINDPPVFNQGADVVVNEDQVTALGVGRHRVAGWATGIAAGPAGATDELPPAPTSQTVSFRTRQVGGTLQLVPNGLGDPVTVDPMNGNLDFTTVLNSNGIAEIEVTLSDTGTPTANTVKTLTITANAINDAPTLTGVTPTQQTVPRILRCESRRSLCSDVDAAETLSGTVHLVLQVSNGTLTVATSGIPGGVTSAEVTGQWLEPSRNHCDTGRDQCHVGGR